MPDDTIPLISPAASSSELSLTSLPTLTCFALGINDFTSEANAFPISTAVSPVRSLPATPLISYSLKIAEDVTAVTPIQTVQGNFSLRANSPRSQPCCQLGTSSAFQLYMWARRYSPTANNPCARLQKNNP